MSRPRVTKHQREVLDRIDRYSRGRTGYVVASFIGSPGAVQHLIDKGYVERIEVEAWTTGKVRTRRTVAALRLTASVIYGVKP